MPEIHGLSSTTMAPLKDTEINIEKENLQTAYELMAIALT